MLALEISFAYLFIACFVAFVSVYWIDEVIDSYENEWYIFAAVFWPIGFPVVLTICLSRFMINRRDNKRREEQRFKQKLDQLVEKARKEKR